MVRIAINGAAGRMGQVLMEACTQTKGLSLAAAIEQAEHQMLGKSIASLLSHIDLKETAKEVVISSNLETLKDEFDLLIDFTRPASSMDSLKVCRQHGKAMVIGTTGFTENEKKEITNAAKDIPIVFAPNMSIGVNLCFKLAELAAQIIGNDADIEIIEAHHRNKVDAPSGTALKLGEIIAKTLGRNLEQCAVYGRQGHTGVRKKETIGFETIRAGDIVGDHTVLFSDAGERIEITHKASNRLNYARGAMKAALWLQDKQNGIFDMQDVLGL